MAVSFVGNLDGKRREWVGREKLGGGGLSGKFGDEKAEGFSGGKVAGWSGIIAACGFCS